MYKQIWFKALKFILFIKLKTYVHTRLQRKFDKTEHIVQTF